MGHVAAGRSDRPGQEDVRRNRAARAFELGQNRAHVRVLDAAAEEPARLHHLVAGVVDGCRGMVNRPHQRHLVHHAGEPREGFADLDAGDAGGDRPERAADLRGSVRLGVPRVELRGPSDQEERSMQLTSRWRRRPRPRAARTLSARAVPGRAWQRRRPGGSRGGSETRGAADLRLLRVSLASACGFALGEARQVPGQDTRTRERRGFMVTHVPLGCTTVLLGELRNHRRRVGFN